jgi:hypothetical protein
MGQFLIPESVNLNNAERKNDSVFLRHFYFRRYSEESPSRTLIRIVYTV